MNRRGFSVATGMFSILLLAANLAVLRHLPWPALDFTLLHTALGLLPILNVLVILGYRLIRNPGTRHPWAMPLFIFGPLAMLAHVSWIKFFPDQVGWICRFPDGVFFQFCKAYRVPDYEGVSPEGYSYFRYYPAVVLLKFSVLQLIAAGLSGVCYILVIRFRNGRVPDGGAGRAEEEGARRIGSGDEIDAGRDGEESLLDPHQQVIDPRGG